MSITSVLTAVSNLIKDLDDYDKKNVSIGDFTILSGGQDQAAVILYRPSRHGPGRVPAGHQKFVSEHNIIIRLYRRYIRSSTSYANLISDADAVIVRFNKYPRLNVGGNVRQALITNTSDIAGRFDLSNESPSFLRIELSLQVTETVTPAAEE